MRSAIGETRYRRENRRLRAVGLVLSSARDAQVVMVTFDKTLAGLHPRRALKSLRNRLKKRVLGERQARLDPSTRATIIVTLDAEIDRIKRFRPSRRDIERSKKDLRRIYRKGRRTLARAIRKPSDESFHEARKGAKYLSLAMHALETGGIEVNRKAARRARAVAHLLGQDHDLALLRSRLAPLLDDPAIDRQQIAAMIATARRKSKAKALRTGRCLYDRKPRGFVSHAIGFPRTA